MTALATPPVAEPFTRTEIVIEIATPHMGRLYFGPLGCTLFGRWEKARLPRAVGGPETNLDKMPDTIPGVHVALDVKAGKARIVPPVDLPTAEAKAAIEGIRVATGKDTVRMKKEDHSRTIDLNEQGVATWWRFMKHLIDSKLANPIHNIEQLQESKRPPGDPKVAFASTIVGHPETESDFVLFEDCGMNWDEWSKVRYSDKVRQERAAAGSKA